jgi:hypothetical protein
VAKTQEKDIHACIKDFAKGKSLAPASTIEDRPTADHKGQVAKAKAKTGEDHSKNCSARLPEFGSTDPNTVNTVAMQKQIDLIH